MSTTYNNGKTYILTQAQFNSLVQNNGLEQGATYKIKDGLSQELMAYIDAKIDEKLANLSSQNN